tara:strand:+ start:1068 stop:1511 length:444 start_codon:yes stop_codon:yes gene_type:complete
MSLNYSISTRHETADTIPNIDNYRGKTGWVTQLQNEYGSKFSDEATIDSHLTGVEKYAYEHDVAGYTWKTDSSGKKVYTPTGVQNPVKGNYAKPSSDPITQKMYQNSLAASNASSTQQRTGYQQASQSVFDTSASRYAPAHQNVVNF